MDVGQKPLQHDHPKCKTTSRLGLFDMYDMDGSRKPKIWHVVCQALSQHDET